MISVKVDPILSGALKNFPVHVGFGKCGSSFLQFYLYHHPQLTLTKRPQVRPLLISNNDLAYDPQPAREYFANYAVQCQMRDRQAVLSSERLVGNVLTGHYDMQAIAYRLNEVFESPRIIMMIRSQTRLIASVYRQYLKVGGTKSLEQFVAPGDGRIPVFDWRAYEFHRVVELYQKIFGRENVLVIPLEQIKKETESVLKSVCNHCGVDFHPNTSEEARNIGFDDSRLAARRYINSIFRPRMPNLRDGGGPGFSREGALYRLVDRLEATGIFRSSGNNLTEQIETLFAERYEPSNRRLAKLINYDLAGAGYRM